MKKIIFISGIFLLVYFGVFIINSKIDKFFYFAFLCMVMFIKYFKLSYSLLLYLALIFLTISVIFFMINSPYGDYVYYFQKTAFWSFFYFIGGLSCGELSEYIKKLQKKRIK